MLFKSKAFNKVVMSGLVLAIVWVASPDFRALFINQIQAVTGWSEKARQADPVGFINHVETSLRNDIQKFNEIRKTLSAEVGTLSKTEREQQALLLQGEQFAEEFRLAYQSGQFPVEVQNAAYTENDLKIQVSTLLSEISGYKANLKELAETRQKAESMLESLIVRIDKTEAQLASISTQREMLKARELNENGTRLLAQVDELLNGNQQVIASNPVRSIPELQTVVVQSKPFKSHASQERVISFLRQTGKVQSGKVQTVSASKMEFSKRDLKPVPAAPGDDDQGSIFQQSAPISE
jgi:phage shock protein A